MVGSRFLDLFEVYRPRLLVTMADLLAHEGAKLHLRFRDAPRTSLKGVLVPDGQGGAVIDLSFGISVVDAVRDYDLTGSDFAPTDLTIEMLYLVEAKSAAMEASRTLNKRLQGARVAAEEQAFTDTLTGLKNRRATDHILGRLVRTGRDFALMHLDLDFFKEVNDSFGHAAGDYVLQQVARILVGETRKDDTAARVGGDEFVVIFVGVSDRHRLSDIADRIIARLERPIAYDGQKCRISGSIGITFSSGRADVDPADVMQEADLALYASKRGGRAQHRFYDPTMTQNAENDAPFGV
ncbi:diguanylate cyclase [Puniceibacterium sediminis]|uniref:Diguanylate cyclase n=2 Tax=Puniceibacterium sediminis TaxID=1608407 RepID=A0A238Y013_9RHOB|nr:diguanylate cyclase [Puniceibacterium sediminis]